MTLTSCLYLPRGESYFLQICAKRNLHYLPEISDFLVSDIEFRTEVEKLVLQGEKVRSQYVLDIMNLKQGLV